jgi:hypothetical protein
VDRASTSTDCWFWLFGTATDAPANSYHFEAAQFDRGTQ